jgi:hypothetical protein
MLDEFVERLDDLARNGLGLYEASGVGLPNVVRNQAQLTAEPDMVLTDEMDLDRHAMSIEGSEVMAVEMGGHLGIGRLARLDHADASGSQSLPDECVGLGKLRLDLGRGGETKGDAVDLGQLERALARDGVAGWFCDDIDEGRRRCWAHRSQAIANPAGE